MNSQQMQEFFTAMANLVGGASNKEQGVKDNFSDLLVKALASNNTATMMRQPGGIFSTPNLDNTVISTHVMPKGLGALLPIYPNNLTDPRYGVLTGFTAEVGSRPATPCSDAPAGYIKAATLMAQFGRVAHQTNTIEVDKLFEEIRGGGGNLRLLGTVLGEGLRPNMSSDDMLDLVVKSEMVSVGVQFERDLANLLWQGNPANNNAGGGHKEFPGLDLQIATGQVDAESNAAVTALDSYISDFNYNLVGGTTKDIVDELTYMEYFLFHLAEKTGMAPVEWVLVMRPELWFELTAVWPCRYLTNRCSNFAGSSIVTINDDNSIRMRDAMRAGMYIEINGRRYTVVTDDGLVEKTNVTSGSVPAGSYASSIYMVPMRARGNFPVTYWEHKNYRGLTQQLAPMGQGAKAVQFWTDDGRFMWTVDQRWFCFLMQAKIEPRVLLRTPHLAGKIQNVLYTPKRHLVSSDPSSTYFRNGGVSVRNMPAEGYAVWK